jgi:hypothetical protein
MIVRFFSMPDGPVDEALKGGKVTYDEPFFLQHQ